MSTSFEEAVAIVAKRRKISEDEAALIVAEEYATLTEIEEADPEGRLLDAPDDAEVWLRQHEVVRGRPVPIDEDRSAQGTIFAQAERMAAKAEGDWYREMSRRVD